MLKISLYAVFVILICVSLTSCRKQLDTPEGLAVNCNSDYQTGDYTPRELYKCFKYYESQENLKNAK